MRLPAAALFVGLLTAAFPQNGMAANCPADFVVAPSYTTLPGGDNLKGVAIASDFNADSKPDLVTANWGTNNVSVFLGKRSNRHQHRA